MIRNVDDDARDETTTTSNQDRRTQTRLARGTSRQDPIPSTEKCSPQLKVVPDAVIVIDACGDIVEANALAGTLLGYDQHELAGIGADLVLSCPTMEGEHRDYARQIHVEFVTGAEGARVFHKSQRPIAVDVMLSPDVANQTVVAVIRECMPHDRRHLRDEDVAMIGHDLRSPLSVISLELALLDHKLVDQPSSDAAAALRRIGRNLDHINHLVSDLLDLSAIDGARFQIDRRPVELAGLISEVVERAIATAHRDRVKLKLDGTALVIGDERRIERVLANFLHNALRYTPSDSPITVALSTADGHARVAVIDAGPGLAPDEARCVFDKFRRTSSSRGRGGFGLGLFVGRKIIDAHGGRIGVESTFGKGSCFYFELPLAPPHATASM
jgi:PAS domain S-box-containing protein